MDRIGISRRDYLLGTGALVLATTLAGCGARGRTPTPTPTRSPTEPTLGSEPDYGTWFDGVSTYTGTEDWRDRETVTVTVGSKGSLGYFKFAPPAVAVSPGTTVRFAWSGHGGSHDVVALDGSFTSGPLTDRPGHVFEHRFETPGVHRYYCTPHRGMGMRGAVTVLA
jgi:halocyanin-like protein